MNIGKYIFLFWLLGGYTGCKSLPPTEENFHKYLDQMYGKELALLSEEELSDTLFKKYLILDTRAQQEYKVSHLPGAKWVGYRGFRKDVLDSVPKDKPVLVYCSVGYRSERIGLKIKDMGFKNVSNLYGGIFEWNNHGRFMHNKWEKPTDSIHTYNRKWGKWVFKGVKVYDNW